MAPMEDVKEELVQATVEAPVVVGAVTVPLFGSEMVDRIAMRLAFRINCGSAYSDQPWQEELRVKHWHTDNDDQFPDSTKEWRGGGDDHVTYGKDYFRDLATTALAEILAARVTADAPSTLGAGGSLEPHTSVEAPVGFTPGPWRAEPGRGGYDIVGPDGEDLGFVNISDGLDEPSFYPVQNNAELIASAPDLLAERNRLIEALEPFAKAMDALDADEFTDIDIDAILAGSGISADDLRRARENLKASK